MRTITLEEHYATPGNLNGPGRKLKERASLPGSPLANIVEKLCDVSDGRSHPLPASHSDLARNCGNLASLDTVHLYID